MRVPMDGHFRAYRAMLALAIVDLTVAGCSCGEELMIFESSHAHVHARHFLPFRRIPPQEGQREDICIRNSMKSLTMAILRLKSNSLEVKLKDINQHAQRELTVTRPMW